MQHYHTAKDDISGMLSGPRTTAEQNITITWFFSTTGPFLVCKVHETMHLLLANKPPARTWDTHTTTDVIVPGWLDQVSLVNVIISCLAFFPSCTWTTFFGSTLFRFPWFVYTQSLSLPFSARCRTPAIGLVGLVGLVILGVIHVERRTPATFSQSSGMTLN